MALTIAEKQPMPGVTVYNVANKTDHMAYYDSMEELDSPIKEQVLRAYRSYDAQTYSETDVLAALEQARQGALDVKGFAALLSPAAEIHLEEMARAAKTAKQRYFGNSVYLFTPLYLANYCENYCVILRFYMSQQRSSCAKASHL